MIIRSRNEKGLEKRCESLREILQRDFSQEKNIEIIGPAPLPFYKLRNYFRWHVMLKGTDLERMRVITDVISASVSRTKDTYLAIDVDPVSIL